MIKYFDNDKANNNTIKIPIKEYENLQLTKKRKGLFCLLLSFIILIYYIIYFLPTNSYYQNYNYYEYGYDTNYVFHYFDYFILEGFFIFTFISFLILSSIKTKKVYDRVKIILLILGISIFLILLAVVNFS